MSCSSQCASVALALVAFLLAGGRDAHAVTVTLSPSKDNTLVEEESGLLSNGAGVNFFVGVTNQPGLRRGLVAFDVAGIPAGATVTSASLKLHMSQTIAGPTPIELHRVLVNWGEGRTFASGAGGLASTGEATWLHRFFFTDLWTAPGGDFAPAASATLAVAGLGVYTWGPASGMVADVQGWVNSSSSNFGWLLLGDESRFPTAKKFDSRENPEPTFRPELTVDYNITVGVEATTWATVKQLFRP